MPSLTQILPANDIGFLRIVSTLWGVDLISTDPAQAALELADSLCDVELLEEVVTTLPAEGRTALQALFDQNGRMPWVVFARRFGEIREMGAGKRDREQPQSRPVSAAEVLFYRGLLAKAFFDPEKTAQEKIPGKGVQEFAFIPDDLYSALDFSGIFAGSQQQEMPAYTPDETPADEEPVIETLPPVETAAPVRADILGRPASPLERAVQFRAADRILDDACTYLSAMRMGIEPPELFIPADFISQLLRICKLITTNGLDPEAVKAFLGASREKAMETLRDGWQSSEVFNELMLLPGLLVESGVSSQPLVTREFLINLLEPIPDGQWWSLPAFIRDVKTRCPDFQRPAGDYDSWFIRRQSDNVFLRGFSNWDEIDGALIRYLVTGPLYWLGFVDLAAADEKTQPAAFCSPIKRTSAAANGKEENGKLNVTSQGRITIPVLAPRAVRYQVARFCDWDPPRDGEYLYRVTSSSLKRAAEQGLKVEQLLAILRKNASSPIPPPFLKALQRWDQKGSEAQIENLVVLKVTRPELLTELRASRAGRFLGEIIGPTTVVIQAGAQAKVMSALAELGILADSKTEAVPSSHPSET